MSERRSEYIRRLNTLLPVIEHTDLLKLTKTGNVSVPHKLPAPVNEYGIPRPEIMVNELLGHMATKHYIWTGMFDLHHVATPKADYSAVRTKGEGDIGSAFRGASFLKIELPRQMHNFSHAIFELPARPSIDVMRQTMIEVGSARQIMEAINLVGGREGPSLDSHAHHKGQDAIEAAILSMNEPQLGLIPKPEDLLAMDIAELRQATSSLLMVRRFSQRHLIHPAVYREPQTPRIVA